MEGFSARRMAVSLVVSGLFGAFCAYGTSIVQIPGFIVTVPYLASVFYARLLAGFLIGFTGGLKILGGKFTNAAARGALLGAIASVSISFYGGAAVFMGFGIFYGIITDLLATRFGKA